MACLHVLRLLSLVTLVTHLPLASSQANSIGVEGGPACCSLYLMDATGQVALETQRPLSALPAVYSALRVSACTTTPFAVQIWRLVNESYFQFRWQTQITAASSSSSSQSFITVNFDTTPIAVTPEDRLAVFSPLSSLAPLATPFTPDPSAELFLSTERFPDFLFTANSTISTNTQRWTRSFNSSVSFCTLPGCADLGQEVNSPIEPLSTTTIAIGQQDFSTAPLPPGDQCCPMVPCDASGTTNSIVNQTAKIIVLQNTINSITTIINNLYAAKLMTGTCPSGFTPGTYGVGKCYALFRDAVQMAVAVLMCQDLAAAATASQARLLTIQSAAEEAFLKTFIGNNSISPSRGIESYWTAGMYDRVNGDWYWYDADTNTQTPQVYTAWLNGTIPVATSDSDVCSTLTVDFVTYTEYWRKDSCVDLQYYICEAPKTCL